MTPPPRPSANGNGGPPANGGGGATNGAGATPGVTDRQLDAIVKVGRAKGLDPAAVESMSVRVFSRNPAALSREEASTLIKELSNMKRTVA